MRRMVFPFTALIVIALLSSLARSADRLPVRARLSAMAYANYVKMKGHDPHEIKGYSIGQSHIDAAWRWRIPQTHKKVFRTWGQSIDHMERWPGYIFSGSSPQYYEWIMVEHPELFEKIKEREAEGRWEIVGGMWVEPDCNMPEGESFVRQRLLGQRFYLEHFGHISELSWLLDSFGYNYNLPQIAARSGAKYMWTNKLTWNDTTVFPFHNFFWRSPDGSQVMAHICQHSPLPMWFPLQEFTKYQDTRWLLKPGMELVADYSTPEEAMVKYYSNDWSKEMGIFYGMGDGGLGPRESEVQIQRAMAAKGYSRFSTGLDFFKELEKNSHRYPVWDDEMYLEYHRGVFTTHGWIKRANRTVEQMMRTVETLSSVLYALGESYPYETLKETWKLFLLQQFHDILPGSSIPEVYVDAREHYDIIKSTISALTEAAMEKLAAMADTRPPRKGLEPVVVWNSLGWERDGLVELDAPSDGNWAAYGPGGEAVPLQKTGKKLMFKADGLPPAGYKVFFLEKTGDPPAMKGPVVKETDSEIRMENQRLKVAIDRDSGLITSLFDKAVGKEMIGAPSFRIMAFHDRPDAWSAWNIDVNYTKKPIETPKPYEVGVVAEGPLFSEVSIKSEVKTKGGITRFDKRVRLVRGEPMLRLFINADIHMHDALVKVEFNTALDSNTVTADGPYLAVERPAHPSTPSEKAMWELPCHKWIDISEPEAGLALLNNGKYGFSLNKDGTGYRQTIIKAARYPRANPGAENVEQRFQNWPVPTGFTDQGEHRIELALMPHAGGWREAELWEAGYNFNNRLEAYKTVPHKGRLGAEGSFISVESDSVYLGSIKRAYDGGGLVLRLVEAEGRPATARVRLGNGIRISSAAETDLLEMNPAPLRSTRTSVSLESGPYKIGTLKVELAK